MLKFIELALLEPILRAFILENPFKLIADSGYSLSNMPMELEFGPFNYDIDLYYLAYSCS
jgi:hypothetical protein